MLLGLTYQLVCFLTDLVLVVGGEAAVVVGALDGDVVLGHDDHLQRLLLGPHSGYGHAPPPQ